VSIGETQGAADVGIPGVFSGNCLQAADEGPHCVNFAVECINDFGLSWAAGLANRNDLSWHPHAEVEDQARQPQGMDRVRVLRRAVGDDAV
jgi:hypothetical protein